MEYAWFILLGSGVIVVLYASIRMKRRARSAWVDVFTPVHGNEELALEFRSSLSAMKIESRMRYTGISGSPGMGMSGAMEVLVSVRTEDVPEAQTALDELLDRKHGLVEKGESE